MIELNWKDTYSVGITQVDEHHQYLFFLLNEFYRNCCINAPRLKLMTLYNDLIDYTTYHFAEEERWMEESFFPNLEMHKQEHKKFSNRVDKLDNDFHAEKNHILIETATFIHGWIQRHILESDAEFGRFIASKKKDKFPILR